LFSTTVAPAAPVTFDRVLSLLNETAGDEYFQVPTSDEVSKLDVEVKFVIVLPRPLSRELRPDEEDDVLSSVVVVVVDDDEVPFERPLRRLLRS
jgi:hypothetical protein